MSGKLRNYQVLDVLCGGTFYKVKHKVTHKIFAWKACDYSSYTDDRIKRITEDVATISKLESDGLLRYYETIMHAPSKTLYLVMEFNSGRSLDLIVKECESKGRHIAEEFVWHLLHELAKVCKIVSSLQLSALSCRLATNNIFVSETCQLTVDCFTLEENTSDLIRAAGNVARSIVDNSKLESCYSDDLHDVIGFLTDCQNKTLKPDVILYHPTVLTHLETLAGQKKLNDVLIDATTLNDSEINKCDSEKAVELCKAVQPLPRRYIDLPDSPIYCNISPKHKLSIENADNSRGSISPTLAALALELPGFVPRSRKPLSQALTAYKPQPQQVSEDTLSRQWMSRLVALRQREESLNKRERDLIKKEIVNSPNTKFIPLRGSPEVPNEPDDVANGITLPPIVHTEDKPCWASRRRQRRSSSVRTRSQRKSLAYEDLDSSLSADPGDGSMIITAAKITKENMPRRNIFPETSTKKVHFTPVNPFVESDESVTLTFYELENIDRDGYQVPRNEEKVLKDITKFKYLDLEKLTTEKRAAMQWNHSSPSKQPKYTKKTLCDISNDIEGVKRSPSKASLTSKGSNSSRYSMASIRSEWSMESAQSALSKVSKVSGVSTRSTRQSMVAVPQTPAPEKKGKRKSLLPFKTPFKFMTSAKIV